MKHTPYYCMMIIQFWLALFLTIPITRLTNAQGKISFFVALFTSVFIIESQRSKNHLRPFKVIFLLYVLKCLKIKFILVLNFYFEF